MSTSDFYTRTGDRGNTTRLKGERRLSKSHFAMEVIGTIDEATAAIGLARASSRSTRLKEAMITVQRHITRLMTHLSAVPEAREHYPGIAAEDVAWLEALIADLEIDLPPLKTFVLPGDSLPGAAYHVARTVVRRAERHLVAFVEEEPDVAPPNVAYMNRLSSLLFVAALFEDRGSNGN